MTFQAFVINEDGTVEDANHMFVRLEVFTFKPNDDDGTPEIALNATFLREHLRQSGEEPFIVEIVPQMLEACSKEHERAKLESLMRAPAEILAQPIIVIEFPDGECAVADGNHRVMLVHELFRRYKPNKPAQIFAWVVKKPVWEKFLLSSDL
jgi:hypothetical protein